MKRNSAQKIIGGKTCYDLWLLPNFDLNNRNDINSGLAQYQSRPVGNSLEFIPLDNSLSKDIDGDFLLHVLLNDTVKKKNNNNYPYVKYSLETPCYGFKGYN